MWEGGYPAGWESALVWTFTRAVCFLPLFIEDLLLPRGDSCW